MKLQAKLNGTTNNGQQLDLKGEKAKFTSAKSTWLKERTVKHEPKSVKENGIKDVLKGKQNNTYNNDYTARIHKILEHELEVLNAIIESKNDSKHKLYLKQKRKLIKTALKHKYNDITDVKTTLKDIENEIHNPYKHRLKPLSYGILSNEKELIE